MVEPANKIYEWKWDKYYILTEDKGHIAFHKNCCCGCFVFTDHFDREDSTDLGSNWNEIVGDWGIQTVTLSNLTQEQYLVEKYNTSGGTAGALAICTQGVPDRSKGEMIIRVWLEHDKVSIGDTYYIYPCCIDNDDAYSLGPVKVSFSLSLIGSTEHWTTTIYYNDVVQDSYTTPGIVLTQVFPFDLNVCADHHYGAVKAWVGSTVNEYTAWAQVDPGEGVYAGIGHDNAGHLNCFDDFSIKEIRMDDIICETCYCLCDENEVPPLVTATILAYPGNRASCLNGEDWEMTFFKGPQITTWRGVGIGITWELTCGTTNNDFYLNWLDNFGCCGGTMGCLEQTHVQSGGTCDPLNLVFGPYPLSWLFDCDLCFSRGQPADGNCAMPEGIPGFPRSPFCEGEFYIIITE